MIIKAVMDEAISVALNSVGIKELKPNRGPEIDLIQKEFGYLGTAYCALFVQYCYKKACQKFSYPYEFPGTASSQSLFDWAYYQGVTYNDKSLLRAGHIVIWRKFMKWQGHAGLIIATPNPDENSFVTVEGNTSNSDYGSQSDGDGIYSRIRYVRAIDFKMDAFWLRGFINTNLLLEKFILTV